MTEDQELLAMIQKARLELNQNPQFQAPSWKWVKELDDEGFFIFCYLVNDFNQHVLDATNFEETVYTLVMLRHKFLPDHLKTNFGLSNRWRLQLLFNLYEKLKHEDMSWDACQSYIDEQIQVHVTRHSQN